MATHYILIEILAPRTEQPFDRTKWEAFLKVAEELTKEDKVTGQIGSNAWLVERDKHFDFLAHIVKMADSAGHKYRIQFLRSDD